MLCVGILFVHSFNEVSKYKGVLMIIVITLVLKINLFINTFILVNKRERKPKEQSRIDNPVKLATLGTQDTGRRQTKNKTEN